MCHTCAPRVATIGTLLVSMLAVSGAQSLSTSVDISSKYVWHGVSLDNDWVIQPCTSFSLGPWNAYLWANGELTNWNEPNDKKAPCDRFTELDTSVGYSFSSRGNDFALGLTDRQFPITGCRRYREWNASLSRGSLSFTLNGSVDAHTGHYGTLSYCGGGRVGSSVALSFSDKTFERFLYGAASSGFTDITGYISYQQKLAKGWTFTPSLNASHLLLANAGARRDNAWITFNFAH